jgi:hypothetical protein
MRSFKQVLSLEEKGALFPEMGKAVFPLGFPKEEMPHMEVFGILDELHLRKTTELWADDANLGMGSDCRIIPDHFFKSEASNQTGHFGSI